MICQKIAAICKEEANDLANKYARGYKFQICISAAIFLIFFNNIFRVTTLYIDTLYIFILIIAIDKPYIFHIFQIYPTPAKQVKTVASGVNTCHLLIWKLPKQLLMILKRSKNTCWL